MRSMKRWGLFVISFLIAGTMTFPARADTSPAGAESAEKKDCQKCHPDSVNDIRTAGKRHRNVPCAGCHPGHPPEVKKPIEKCSKCHNSARRNVHFESENCLRCHIKPHTPLNMSLAEKGVCLACHGRQSSELTEHKSKHTALGCAACHPVHRLIPKCSQCHTGKSHYEITGCTRCHQPHMPLNMSFAGPERDACASCHSKQNTQLAEHGSKHSLFACTACHAVHGRVPQCTQCHKPHSGEMAAAECGKCHNAHMPRVVVYAGDTPSDDCGSCHKKTFDLLASSEAKHRTLACAFCHQERHKMVPDCGDCHGSPHPAGIMAKFGRCGECHGIAHDLDNWPARTERAGAEKAERIK